jgi:hypothetical protein
MSGERRLGSHYEIGELLGRGGMGEVYRGRNTDDGSGVAIKVLRPEYATDRRLVGRFIQERDILVSLNHPNLVRVRDLVAEGNDLAIVMDLVEGGDLRQMLLAHGGTLRAAMAFDIAAQVFDALAVVHGAGVVHRDVKPENILMPVGVARVTGDRGVSTTHTSLIGTPYYMAPELADGRPVNARADLYAMGCMLYELISGTVPFAGSPLLVLRRHADEDPQPIPDLPEQAWQFIAHLMDKEPAARPSASEAAECARGLAQRCAAMRALPLMAAPNPRIRSTGGHELRPSWTGITPPPRPEAPGYDGTTVFGQRPVMPQHADDATVLRRSSTPPPPTTTMPIVVVPTPWYRKPAVMIPAALVVALALVAGLVVVLRGGGDDAAKQTKTPSEATYASAPAVYANGLVATRTWKLVDSTKLSGSFDVTNASAAPAGMEIEELIPKSVAASVDNITFTPAPDKIVERDPIVSYTVKDLAPNARKTFTYTITVEASTEDPQARLARWGAERDALVKARADSRPGDPKPVTLKSIALAPSTVDVEEALTSPVAVTATMTDDQPAVDAVFNAIVYTSSDTNIATVVGGPAPRTITVTGVRAGTATVTAQAGDKNSTLTINVKKKTSTGNAALGNANVSNNNSSNNNSSNSNGGSPTGNQSPVTTTTIGTTSGGPGAVTPPVDTTTSTTTTSTTTTSTTTTTTVPCSIDYGGNGPYPAENAAISGSGAGKECSAPRFYGTGYIGNWNGSQTLSFTVNASNGAGRYNVRLRFQNATGNSTRQLTTSGGATTVAFHNTNFDDTSGNWNAGNWSETIANVVLNGGSNVITLGGGSGFVDLDEIMEVRYTGPTSFSASPGGSSAAGTVYQAESANVSGFKISGSTTNTGYNGAGYIGDYCGNNVTFTVTGGGTRTLRFRYRSADSGAQRLVSVNGQSVYLLNFPNTGSTDWATAAFTEASVTVTLPAGTATVTLEFIGDSGHGYIDLDQLTVAT